MIKNELHVNSYLLLSFIILFGAILRFAYLETNPPAMYGDELTMVYDAYSIAHTGHDQQGNFLPLVFNLGGSRPPLYVYLTAPLTLIFGPTALAVRIISALAGTALIVLLFLLVRHLIDSRTAFFTAFFTAVSPWGIALSRAGFETNLALSLSVLAVYTFFLWIKKNTSARLLISSLGFALSMQTYPTYRLTIPLLLVVLIFLNYRNIVLNLKKSNIYLITSCIAVILISITLSFYTTFGIGSRARFSLINVFSDETFITASNNLVGEERTASHLPKLLAFVFHNRYEMISKQLVSNYLSFYSFDFLFNTGDENPRHNPAGLGEFYLVSLILIIAAFISSGNSRYRSVLLFLIGWLLLAPIAGSLVGKAHALRGSFMLPPLILLSALGLTNLLEMKGFIFKLRYFWLTILLVITTVQFIFMVEGIFILSPKLFADFWSYPAKAAVNIANQTAPGFDYVILSNDIANMEYAYPVYNRLKPDLVVSANKTPVYLGDFKFFKYGKVYIGSIPNGPKLRFLNSLPGKILYIGDINDKTVIPDYKLIDGPTGQGLLVTFSK